MSPFAVILIRVILAAGLFWLISLVLKSEKVERKDIGLIFLCSLFGTSLNILLFYKGLSITTPINATLVMTTTPILVLIASSILIKERITATKIIGICFGLGGVLLLTANQFINFSTDGWLGDTMIFFNAISYGVYLVIAKPLFLKYQPITIFKWMFLMSFFMILPFSYSDTVLAIGQQYPNNVFWVLAYIGICATVITFTLNAWALKRINPSLVGIYIYLQPVVASVISIASGKETFTSIKLVVALMVFIGVYLVSKNPVKLAK